MYKSTRWGFVFTALIVAGCIYAINNIKFQYGIDLQGGTELSYQLNLETADTTAGTGNVANVVKDMISARLDAYGLKGPLIATQGKDRIIVQLPGVGDADSVALLKQQVEDTGTLDFMLIAPDENTGKLGRLRRAVNDYNSQLREYETLRLEDVSATPPKKPQEISDLEKEHKVFQGKLRDFVDGTISEAPEEPEWIIYPRVDSDRSKETLKFIAQAGSFSVLHYENEYKVSGRLLKSARTGKDDNFADCIHFEFDSQGSTQFGDLTRSNTGRLLAIVLDGRIMQSATIQEQINGRGRITGDFSYEQVESVVNILQGGSLPAKPELISENTVGSMLGQESIRSGVQAMLAGLAVVIVFMLIYYLWGGFVATIALILNLVIIMAYVLVFRQTLTFPGIAGVLLTIGMAVDANILIFERVREELRKGKSIEAALGTGYQRAFWVIFDTNLTTLITGIVLFEFGTGPIKGFAITLIAGILASFFTAVFVTRLVLSLFYKMKALKSFPMLNLIGVPRVDFQSHRKPFITLSALVILGSLVLLIARGKENYGIDFTGGSKITMNLASSVKKTQLEDWIVAQGEADPAVKAQFRDYSIQTIDSEDGDGAAKSFSLLVRGAKDEAPGVDGQQQEGVRSQEQRVREVLEDILKKNQTSAMPLLLPNPFPMTEWVGEGEQRLQMTVNLLDFRPPDTQRPREEVLKEYLNNHFNETFRDFVQGSAEEGAFQGIEVTDLTPAAASAPGVLTYSLSTNAYQPPPEGLESLKSSPRQSEVEEAVRTFFRGQSTELQNLQVTGTSGIVELSEPFPQVVTIGGRVASNLQTQGLIAFFIAIVAIIFYLSLRFEFAFGLAAILALVHDVLITIGIMSITDSLVGGYVSLKINLPEVAALLTIIGYSVNDTIVVFDRIRENLKAGNKRLNFTDLANMSINQTLARTVWTSGTTLVVVLMLLAFGGESIKGFAFAFAIGLVTGTYSSIFVATPALIWLRARAEARRERVKLEAQATA